MGSEVNEVWRRLEIHGIPLARYVRKGTHGTEKLREEIEAENEGATIPLLVRWLGKLAEIKERALKGLIRHLCGQRSGGGKPTCQKWPKGDGETAPSRDEKARPGAMCGNCCGWGHIEAQCAHRCKPKCAQCAAEHRTELHRCPVEDCAAARGSACVHVIARCPNCKGPYRATSSQCPNKKEAQEGPSYYAPQRQKPEKCSPNSIPHRPRWPQRPYLGPRRRPTERECPLRSHQPTARAEDPTNTLLPPSFSPHLPPPPLPSPHPPGTNGRGQQCTDDGAFFTPIFPTPQQLVR